MESEGNLLGTGEARKREAILAKVFDLVPDTLTITRVADGRFVEVNGNWEALTGYASEEAIGHTSMELQVWAVPEQRTELLAQLRRDGEVRSFDVTFLHKQGYLYYCKVSASLFESDGEKYMLLAVQDVTRQRAAEMEIRELNQELEDRVQRRTLKLEQTNAELAHALETLQHAKDELVRTEKMAALGSLVAGVAHELNTPIGNGLTVASTLEHKISAFNQAMADGLKRSVLDQFVVDTRNASAILSRNLTRAGELVRSFKQVAVDQTSAQRRKFGLQEVVSEIVLTMGPTIQEGACTVDTSIASDLVLDSYPGPLGQVLSNLISNALIHAYAPGQGGVIGIHAHALERDEIELTVRDQGRGIEPANLKRIFEPFFTTRMGQGGSGLGLHIVHNIVTDVLGGRIDVQSVPGQGTAMTLRLPRTAPVALPR